KDVAMPKKVTRSEEHPRSGCVSKDEGGRCGAAFILGTWFETRGFAALLTMRRSFWRAWQRSDRHRVDGPLLDLAPDLGIDPRVARRQDLQRRQHRVRRLEYRHHRHLAGCAQR